MAKKPVAQTDLSKSLPTINFNLSDRVGRPGNEILKSVQYIPANATGDFIVVGYDAGFYERRGALNAIGRMAFGGDTITAGGLLHLYHRSNPNRQSGQTGWIKASAIKSTGKLYINSGGWFMELPSKVVGEGKDRKKVVDIQTPWLRVYENTGKRVRLSNAPYNEKEGTYPGVILHDFMDAIGQGTTITVVVTVDKLWNASKDANQDVFGSRLQETAMHFRDLWKRAQEEGLDAAREQYFQEQAGKAIIWSEAKKEIRFQEMPVVEGQPAPAPAPLTIRVLVGDEWQTLGISEVLPGHYTGVMLDGKNKVVSVARPNVLVVKGAEAGLTGLARQGVALKRPG